MNNPNMTISQYLHSYTKLHHLFYLDYSTSLLTNLIQPVTSIPSLSSVQLPKDPLRVKLHRSSAQNPLMVPWINERCGRKQITSSISVI